MHPNEAFIPRAAAKASCPTLPAYEELEAWIDAAVQQNLLKHAEESTFETQCVLEREKYEQLLATIAKVHQNEVGTQNGVHYQQQPKHPYEKCSINYMEPFLVYHSTQNVGKVNSILKHGYLLPGQQHPTELWTLGMANGNRLGDGIYCSNHYHMAEWYSFLDHTVAIQLIVNILVPGRVYRYDNADMDGAHGILQNDGTYTLTTSTWRKTKYKETYTGNIHTLWSPGLQQWVVSSSDRLVPMALVTLPVKDYLQEDGYASQKLIRLQDRLSWIRQRQHDDDASVAFYHLCDDLWMVRLATDPRLPIYLDPNGGVSQYANVFVLLITCLQKQYLSDDDDDNDDENCKKQKRDLLLKQVEWFNEHMPSPFEFIKMYKSAESLPRKQVEYLEQIFGSWPGRGSTHTRRLTSMLALCQTLIEEYNGMVPRSTHCNSILNLPGITSPVAADFERLVRLSPHWQDYAQPFFDDTSPNPEYANRFLEHYYVLPPSLLGQAELVKPLMDYIGGWSGKTRSRQFLTITKTNPSSLECIDVTKDTDALWRLHLDHRDAVSSHNDYLVDTLSHFLDRLTLERKEGREQAINVLYLFVRHVPEDMERWENVMNAWKKYLSIRYLTVKVLIWEGANVELRKSSPISAMCTIKASIQTDSLGTTSPHYYWQIQNSTQCEECFQALGDEIENEIIASLSMESVRFAVTYPFGISGEGFLPQRPGAVGFQPVWERHIFWASRFCLRERSRSM